jgi:hypothetical protein
VGGGGKKRRNVPSPHNPINLVWQVRAFAQPKR